MFSHYILVKMVGSEKGPGCYCGILTLPFKVPCLQNLSYKFWRGAVWPVILPERAPDVLGRPGKRQLSY